VHLISHLFGLDNASGPAYLFWSGIAGSFLVNLATFVLVLYVHHTCQDSWRCLRWGKYPAAGGMFKVCRHHHPDLRGIMPRRGHIAALHQAWREGRPGG
jgi:hypothetical protein